MEFRPKLQEAITTNSGGGNQSSTNGGGAAAAPSPAACEANPFPTTFVQADTSSFKQVVQILTGSAETAVAAAATAATGSTSQKSPIPPVVRATGPKKPAFKLYERRNTLKNMKMINPLLPSFLNSRPNSPAAATAAFSPRKLPEVLSPSTLNFPSLSLSPVTPLTSDPFERPQPPAPDSDAAKRAEDRAIAEKGFYLHPSPRSGRGGSEPPRLLPLFPVMPPEAAAAAAAAAAESASTTCN